MSNPKELLPNRRQGFTMDFQTPARLGKSPMELTATLNYNQKNQLKEVFLSSGKTGGDLGILMHEASVLLSNCLRHGVSPEALKNGLPRSEAGEAEGPIGTLLDILTREQPL